MSIITIQASLPGIEANLSFKTAHAVGRLGEMWVKEALNQRGYDVIDIRGTGYGDLRSIKRKVGITRNLEVKTARQGKDGKWRFLLQKDDQYGWCDHSGADVVILLAVCKSGRVVPFVVPSEALVGKRTVSISSHPDNYRGWLSKFRQSRKTLKMEVSAPC